MDELDGTDEDADGQTAEPAPFERFQALTQRLLYVPKHEVDEAVERDRERRRTA